MRTYELVGDGKIAVCFIPVTIAGVSISRDYFFFVKGVDCMADALYTAANNMSSHAPTASASLATISAGSDVLVSNFAGLQSLVDDLTSLASAFKDKGFYTPVGSVLSFAGASAPVGWLLCNGDTVPNGSGMVQSVTADFTDLFAVLGGAYGGAGKLPDLRGRAPIGAGTGSGLTARTLGVSLGAESLPEHSHSISAWSTTDGAGAHSHSVSHTDQVYQGTGPGIWPAGNNGVNGYGAGNQGHSVSTNGAHNHTIPGTNTNNTGSGSHGVMQPSIVTNFIIKY